MPETPDHRTAVSPRSGDDHVITAEGELINAEQLARDNLAAAESAVTATREDRKVRKGADPETPPA